MMNVYLTFDVEIWCNGWKELDERFPASFERYVYGRSSHGNYALPMTLEILDRHRLSGVFFVEPLFSARFGQHWLDTIVGLIRDVGHEVQLHLHPEWTDEISPLVFPGAKVKRQNLAFYTLSEQKTLITLGGDLLRQAGCERISAFRAGSFASSRDTYRALAAIGIGIDSSLNYVQPDSAPDMRDSFDFRYPLVVDGVTVLPVSIFRDGFGRYRPTQVGACSFAEMRDALLSAARQRTEHFVIVSHNFEMLKHQRADPDPIIVSRFTRLCEFLDRNRETFRVASFNDPLIPGAPHGELELPSSSRTATALRFFEQALRRLY
ncbi:MAG: polysaccharide deacetylase [Candidatus Accumulibacter sp.]|uniref:polysaccharide deacetylase family protein n=1 Tax=Accumulibacter sp. TaxID=2053492 RepID=UPI0025860B13|nr:polysaccharide deacetylase [Accumulibacter sp.]MCM8620683.1 polysaccharide deacetylase [Accumulibacter sp.]